MRFLFILPFVVLFCGCEKRSEISTFSADVEQLPLYTSNTLETGSIDEQTAAKDISDSAGINDTADNTKENDEEDCSDVICIHICGAVNDPGVYELPKGSRLYEAVCAAGGYAFDADEDYVNQALILSDSDKIVIPTLEQTAGLETKELQDKTETFGVEGSTVSTGTGEEASGKVNINTASADQLCTLSGIGEARAKVIIAYRTENGPFSSIEDIMNVSGIKQASFDKIKNDICVN